MSRSITAFGSALVSRSNPRALMTTPVVMLALATLASCGNGSSSSAEREVVTVFAAASLGDAFTAMEEAIEAANPAIDVQLSLAGSSALREQILDGAPADVFASANETVMADVVDAGAASSPQVFATNELVIAANVENDVGAVGLADFERPELFVGVCAPEVPCGSAAVEVFASAGVTPQLDTEEPDVRRLLAKIIDGELDVGLVYATDVIAADGAVAAFELPVAVSSTNRYSVAALESAEDPDAAALVVGFITSSEGRAVLETFGFGS